MVERRTRLGDTITNTYTKAPTARFGFIENITLEIKPDLKLAPTEKHPLELAR
jgi:hypothetical protein